MPDRTTASSLTTSDPTPVTNDTIRTLMSHRTIRAFTDDTVSDDQLTTLFQVASRSASSSYNQQFTIIHVTDPAIRQQIYQSSGQPYVDGDRGELLIFVADLYRNAQIMQQAGREAEPQQRINLFLTAVADAFIAAQNVVVAAESMGLGTVYLGSINADPRRVITALGLPPLTYPIVGLLVGHPDQDPQYKPRLPLEYTIMTNTYTPLTDPVHQLAEYDDLVQEYYDQRASNVRSERFTTLIATTYGNGASLTSDMLDVLHEQGLVLK